MLTKLIKGLQIKRGTKLVWDSSRKWFLLNATTTILMSIEPVLGLYLVKVLFDYLTAAIANETEIVFSSLTWLIVAIAAVEIIGLLISSASKYITTAQSEHVQDHVMLKLHKKSVELDLAYYENPSYYDTLHLAQVEAPKRTAQFVNDIALVAQTGLSLVAVVALLVSYHWGIAGLLVIAVIPGLIVNLKSADKLYNWRLSATAKEREAKYYHELLTYSNSAKETRVFGFGDVLISWYSKIRVRLRCDMLKIVQWEHSRSFIVNGFGSIVFYIGFFYFVYKAAIGVFTMGDIALFYAAFYRAQGQLKSVITGVSSLYQNNLFLDSLFQILRLQPSIKSGSRQTAPPKEPTRIEFRKIGFNYPGSSRKAIKDISININPGEHIAIVGKNGSGKSTFVKLLCRLYDRAEGEILMNGRDIREYEVEAYREQFGVLFQDHLHLGLSVRENIWLGDIRKDKHGKEIAEAAHLSGASKLIENLPSGYETVLGKVLKDGEQLSQGEWQKIALARALFRNANITILDEPTSWMDPEAEYAFFEKFHEMAKGKTAIMISHRLSSVRMVDKIIVIENGLIVECGSHDELIQKNGRYAEIFETQAINYRLPTNEQ